MTEDEKPRPDPDNTVKSVDRQPCGCVKTMFESGRGSYAPCPPCGLFQSAFHIRRAAISMLGFFGLFRRRRVAGHLATAADAMAAVATTLQSEQRAALRRQAMIDQIKKAQADTARQDEADAGKAPL